MSLTLRQYTVALILAPMMLGLVMTFSSGVFNVFDADIEDDGIKSVEKSFEESQTGVEDDREELNDVDIRTGFFFLSEIWNVITGVIGSVGNLTSLFTEVAVRFNMPSEIIALGSIVIAGVVWEIVSLARGMRT